VFGKIDIVGSPVRSLMADATDGTKTTSNSRPLAEWTVISFTES
jgi:hypothetical protein